MTHLEIENVASDYLEGLLGSPERAAVEAHLAACPACREMLDDVRHVLELCRGTEEVEPKPWLINKILLATTGKHEPTWIERLAAFFRPALQSRVAYPVAMTVFTFSIIVNAAGLNLRNLRFADLNPRTWVDQGIRRGHLVAARAEKFYYDLRVVVELEARFRELRGQSQEQEEKPPNPEPSGGGSSQGTPPGGSVAFQPSASGTVQAQLLAVETPTGHATAGRSLNHEMR